MKTIYSGQNKNIAQNLIVGLIYPAILGTFIYSLFDTILNSIIKEPSGFLADTPYFVIMKTLLIIGVIGFYCCDFLYSVFTKNFKTRYFYFDIIILFGLSLTFRAININNQDPPNLDYVILSFLTFMVLYFIWDYFEIGNTEGRENQNIAENKFYSKMVKWELYSTTFLSLNYIFFKTNLTGYNLTIFLTATIIIMTTICFIYLVREKRVYIDK